jgi:hypothetical protein
LSDGTHPSISPKPQGLLYHYTDQNGLKGILENKQVWATHVGYLNDSTELHLGWSKAWGALFDLTAASDKPQLEKVYSKFRDTIENYPERRTYYVWSLTDDKSAESSDDKFDGDRLSQWRGYSGGASGFSLGFDVDVLEDSFCATTEPTMFFDRCEYSRALQDQRIGELASKHRQRFQQLWQNHLDQLVQGSVTRGSDEHKKNEDNLMSSLIDIYADFVQFGMFIKHPGFKEEKEWRYVFLLEESSRCSVRSNSRGLVPYIPIGIDMSRSPSPLRRIVIGPGPHMSNAVETVKLLLAKGQIPVVEVAVSRIPYRTW